MPIYEYQCKKCGDKFEIRQKMSEPPLKLCAFCGDGHLEKLISLSSFRLKGPDWYSPENSGKYKARAT